MCSAAWQRTCFGSKESVVQIHSPRQRNSGCVVQGAHTLERAAERRNEMQRSYRCHNLNSCSLVGVAQLAEPWIVVPVVAGSNPVIHPDPSSRWDRPSSPVAERLAWQPANRDLFPGKWGTVESRESASDQRGSETNPLGCALFKTGRGAAW